MFTKMMGIDISYFIFKTTEACHKTDECQHSLSELASFTLLSMRNFAYF